MKAFWTEKEIEGDYLVPETRTVHLPGGRTTTLTCFRLVWQNLDGLLAYNLFSEEDLADRAQRIARETGENFSATFPWVVGYAFREMCLVHYAGGIPAACAMTPAQRS